MARVLTWGLAALLLAACDSMGPANEPGFADVVGHVRAPSGLPLPGALVSIDCGERALTLAAPTDSLGYYHVTLRYTLPAGHGQIDCAFAATAAGHSPIVVESSIGFAPAGVPHALQFLDLQE